MVMKPDMQNLFQSGPCRTTRCLADNMGEYINRRNYLQNLGFSLKKVTKPIGHAATSVGKGVVKAAPTVERVSKDAAPFVPLAVAVIAL